MLLPPYGNAITEICFTVTTGQLMSHAESTSIEAAWYMLPCIPAWRARHHVCRITYCYPQSV